MANFWAQLLIALFEAANDWRFSNEVNVIEGPAGKLTIRRRNQFDQDRKLMSVVVEDDHSSLTVYVKGAPESISSRCSKNLNQTILQEGHKLAAEGCYVLGVAKKTVALAQLEQSRDEMEHDLTFLGLIVFRNELKRDAEHAIKELKAGSVRCVMITGDNAPCGAFIARQAGLVESGKKLLTGSRVKKRSDIEWCDESTSNVKFKSTSELMADAEFQQNNYELVVNGEALDILNETGELYRILRKIRVFARMTPNQKVQVVHAFMEGPDGVVCAMAGDGGNDSGALRAAHVGLSMSAAEASIVAPFSSGDGTVFSCVDLIIEGRAALATSLASFKVLIVYGLLFSLANICSFYYAVLLPLLAFIMLAFLALVPMTFLMTLSKPLKHLGQKRPTSSLMGVQTVSSLAGFYLISLVTTLINLNVMESDENYVRWPSYVANTAAWWYLADNWEATVIFETVFPLFLISGFAFSFGSGFRENVLKNIWLMLFLLTSFLISTFILVLPPTNLSVQFHIANEQFNRNHSENPIWQAYQAQGGEPSPAMSSSLRLLIWLLTVIAMLTICLWERFVVHGPGGRYLKQCYLRKCTRKKVLRYEEFDSF